MIDWLGGKIEEHRDGNLASKILAEASQSLGLDCVGVMRATDDCQFANRCGSGCALDRKNVPIDRLSQIPESTNRGAIEFRLNSNVDRIKLTKLGVELRHNNEDERFDRVVISAGVTQTPNLLMKSKLLAPGRIKFKFHLNFKFLVDFGKDINSSHATMLTAQMQQYIADGFVVMSGNVNDLMIDSALLGLNEQKRGEVKARLDQFGLFVLMVKSESPVTYLRSWVRFLGNGMRMI